jgi:hypothetical protein
LGSLYPRSQNWDLGHPSFLAIDAKSNRRSFDSAGAKNAPASLRMTMYFAESFELKADG